jgi:hypothetical protein
MLRDTQNVVAKAFMGPLPDGVAGAKLDIPKYVYL